MPWPDYYAFSLANHACPHPSPNQQLIDRPAMLMPLSLSHVLSLFDRWGHLVIPIHVPFPSSFACGHGAAKLSLVMLSWTPPPVSRQ